MNGANSGDVLLDGLRVNQLKLSRNLAGSLQVSDKEVHMHAKVASPGKRSCWICLVRSECAPCLVMLDMSIKIRMHSLSCLRSWWICLSNENANLEQRCGNMQPNHDRNLMLHCLPESAEESG